MSKIIQPFGRVARRIKIEIDFKGQCQMSGEDFVDRSGLPLIVPIPVSAPTCLAVLAQLIAATLMGHAQAQVTIKEESKPHDSQKIQ